MENHELIYTLQKLLPGSLPGKDYTVQTEYQPDGVTVLTPARIATWSLPMDPPDIEVLGTYWTNTYSDMLDAEESTAIAAEEARVAQVVANAII